jgi:NAD-dependent deacetylase
VPPGSVASAAVAVNAGQRLVIVNRDPTPYDDVATAVIREPIGEVVPLICAALSNGGRDAG